MDFLSIRKEYENKGIVESQLNDCPIAQFRTWYDDANGRRPGNWFETNAMALATADRNGQVTVRYVLLKGIVAEGVRFFTNYDSVKGRQLAENPKCSVAFHWPFLGRQVRIEGEAEKTTRKISEEYFHLRPHSSQVSAVISDQSSKIVSHDELERKRQAFLGQHGNAIVPLPDNWGGYLIRPARFEFWQGRLDRLHDRIVYELNSDKNQWERFRLSP